MKNLLKFNTMTDCIAAIRTQMEMIKFTCGDEHTVDIDKLTDEICDGLNGVNNDLFNSEDVEYDEEPVKHSDSIQAVVDKQAVDMKDAIDKEIFDDVMKEAAELDTTSTETVGGLTGVENMGPGGDETVVLNPDQSNNLAFISGLEDKNGDLTAKGEAIVNTEPPLNADFEDTKNPVDLEEPPAE